MAEFVTLFIPFAGTTLGAAMVFLMKEKISPMVEKALLGFAAGVMIAASISAAECFTYHICIQIIMKQLKSERYVFK